MKKSQKTFSRVLNWLGVALVVAGVGAQAAFAGVGPTDYTATQILVPMGNYSVGQSVVFDGTVTAYGAVTISTCTLDWDGGGSAPATISGPILGPLPDGATDQKALNATATVQKDTRYYFDCNDGFGGSDMISGNYLTLDDDGTFFDPSQLQLPITNLQGIFQAPNTIKLTWDAVDGADEYQLYGSDGGVEGQMCMIDDTSVTTNSATVTVKNVANCNNNDLQIFVSAYKNGQHGQGGASVTVVLAETLPANALITSVTWPSGKLTAGQSAPFSANVTAAATECGLQKGSTTYGATIVDGKATTGLPIFPDASQNTAWTLVCQNADGAIEKSGPWTPTPANINYGPSAPTNVKAQTQADGSVKVTWTASTDSDGVKGYELDCRYNITAGGGGSSSYCGDDAIATSETSFTISSARMQELDFKEVQVIAYDSANPSAQSMPSAFVAIAPFSDSTTPPANGGDNSGGAGDNSGNPSTSNSGGDNSGGSGTSTSGGSNSGASGANSNSGTNANAASASNGSAAGTTSAPGYPNSGFALPPKLRSVTSILIVGGLAALAVANLPKAMKKRGARR